MSSESKREVPSSPTVSLSDIPHRAGQYLFAISDLSASGTVRITTGELRDYLNVTAASVTEMVSKLDDRGLVDYEKYEGVKLTHEGEILATQAGWRFCVVSTFFDSVLDVTLDDDMAFDIGFVLPKSAILRLQELVDTACLGLCPTSNGEAMQCVA